jgi:hypothetical protein
MTYPQQLLQIWVQIWALRVARDLRRSEFLGEMMPLTQRR